MHRRSLLLGGLASAAFAPPVGAVPRAVRRAAVSGAPLKPRVLRPCSNRVLNMGSNDGATFGSETWVQSCATYTMMGGDGTDIQLAFHNWRTSQSNAAAGSPPTVTAFIKAKIEYPVDSGNLTTVVWQSPSSATVASSASSGLSNPVPISVPMGGKFRIWFEIATSNGGFVMRYGGTPISSADRRLNGTGGGNPPVALGTNITGWSQAPMVLPSVVMAKVRRKNTRAPLALIGDSNAVDQLHVIDSWGNADTWLSAIDDASPTFQAAGNGCTFSATAGVVSTWAPHVCAYYKRVFVFLGTNDLRAAASLATLQGYANTIGNAIIAQGAQPIFGTLPPCQSGAFDAVRNPYNDWLRTLPFNAPIYDIAQNVEDPNNPGHFKPGWFHEAEPNDVHIEWGNSAVRTAVLAHFKAAITAAGLLND